MKKILIFITFLFYVSILFSQEALKSTEEDYYDFLALDGITERPTLGYRTLSDSVWEIKEEKNHIWKNNNLGCQKVLWESENQGNNWFTKGFFHGTKIKIFGPEWFNSFNTTAPYGQNDGALWQGKGYNTSFSTGIRVESFGFELTVKPQVSFSQNLEFEYITPNYQNENSIYSNKAGIFGYYGVRSLDAPQRFGNKSIITFDFGDSEIRYNWYSFTIGFGTQSIWLGPAKLNPIIHSNNAPSYPKFDIGIRKQKINLPWWNISLGEIEFRGWVGKLSESDFFDTDDTNNDNLISGLSVAWSLPWIFKGLTIGFNRTMLSKWNKISPYTLFEIYIPWMKSDAGEDESDQRASITIDYLIPKVGFEIYFEWARNDFQTADGNFIRYPFHTQAWTVGSQKSFDLSDKIKGNFLIEVLYLECSHDYMTTYEWYSTFYAHHKITQGYTNKGQWLGSGIGTGGNSQFFGFELLYPRGKSTLSFQRINPDLDYIYYVAPDRQDSYASKMNTLLIYGFENLFFITNNIIFDFCFKYIHELSANYEEFGKRNRLYFSLNLKYNI